MQEPATLGAEFAQALSDKDFGRLLDLMHPEIHFRGMTPSRFWEATDPDALTSAVLREWFEGARRDRGARTAGDRHLRRPRSGVTGSASAIRRAASWSSRRPTCPPVTAGSPGCVCCVRATARRPPPNSPGLQLCRVLDGPARTRTCVQRIMSGAPGWPVGSPGTAELLSVRPGSAGTRGLGTPWGHETRYAGRDAAQEDLYSRTPGDCPRRP